jgi:DNA-binding SARP family transcriptional activator
MEFRILGPLSADPATGLGPVAIRQPLLQSALSLLLLRANMTCPRDWLIDALWGGEPPAAPEAALRVCMSRLRRDLGDCADRLETIGPSGGRAPGHRLQRGYRMRVRPGELDLDEFGDLTAQGRAELDIGNAGPAAAVLAQALALWGDPPLPSLPSTPTATAAAAELLARRDAALADLIEARMAAGHYEQVLARLRAAVIADPGNERTSAQLMRAYRALGMPKDALDVYRRARRAMLAELGAEPGPELAWLHSQILAEELASDGPAAQLTRLSPVSARLPAWQVPAPPSDFTGREDEIRQVMAGLAGRGVPVVVLTGGPGAGKTVTAAAAALRLRTAFPDGQLYAELGGVEHPRDPQQVLADLLESLGVAQRTMQPPGPSRAAAYRSLLADRRVLIVADDAASARQIRPLLPGASGAAVLITSRGRLTGLAGARLVELGGLTGEAALELLASASGDDRLDADREAAERVAAACGGLPLALRVSGCAIATRPGLGVAGLARALTEPNPIDVLAVAEMSVSAAISSSYYAISESARAALCLAAATMTDDIPAWTLDSALSRPASGPDIGRDGIADQLCATGLVSPAAGQDAARYRMHPLTRAYAAERWPGYAADCVESVRRFRAGWLRHAGQAATALPAVPFIASPITAAEPAWTGARDGAEAAPGAAGGLQWLTAERANLLAVTLHASESGDRTMAAALGSRLIAGQCLLGRFDDADRVWRSVIAAANDSADGLVTAQASYYLAVARVEGHDHAAGTIQLLRGCIPVLEQGGDRARTAMSYGLLAGCASVRGRYAQAIRSARRALQLAGQADRGELTRCAVQAVLGLTFARMGITSRGLEDCRRALADARELDQPAYLTAALRAAAQALILAGQHTAAADLCAEGLSVARGYGSEIAAARFLVLLGRAGQRRSDWPAATASLAEAQAIFCELGSVTEEVTATSLLAACYRAAGDDRGAAAQLDHLAGISANSAGGAAGGGARDPAGRDAGARDPAARDARARDAVLAACEAAAS